MEVLEVMSGSTIINQRQHVGLQKLSALSAIATQFLGPTKSYKFIQDEATGESALVSSCHRALENLELTCAVGQLVYETIEAHQKIYKTGSECLLFLAGAWSRTALECLHCGIPIPQIISAMAEGMDICLSVCRQFTIPFEELHVTPKARTGHLSNNTVANNQMPLNNKAQRKLKLSRHFHEPESENTTATPQTNSENSKLVDIARTLSHGCTDTMDLVIKVSHIQLKQGLTFDVAKISTCLMPGSAEDNASVLTGCIVHVSPEQAIIACHVEGRDLKMAVLDGDLTSTFRHLGYNKPKRLKHVSDCSSSEPADEEWLEGVVGLLLNLEVNIMLISGVANGKLKHHFWTHHILVVEKVSLSVLKTFAVSTGAVLVSYATQLNSECVGSGVNVSVMKDFGNESKRETALNISTSRRNGLVTVVLTSCVPGKLRSVEDTFWACAYRLHWALRDKALLLGAGVTEMSCICQLQKQSQVYGHRVQQINPRTAAGCYAGVVLQLMADGLMDFLSSVMVNAGRYSKMEARTLVTEQLHDWDGSVNGAKFWQMCLKDESEDSLCGKRTICDNVVVKQEVWRKALDLVFLVLQTDAEIIIGVDQKGSEQSGLMFL